MRSIKLLSAAFCCLLIILQVNCSKTNISSSDESEEGSLSTVVKSDARTTQISDTNTLEKPLKLFKDQPIAEVQSLSLSSTYGCGSSMSGNYYSTGSYTYPDYTLDVGTILNGSTISLNVAANDVPNRFDIYDHTGTLVVSSGWMGYATYQGPWGTSLNTPNTKTITFIKANPGSYKLRVQTLTQSYSDAWSASLGCSNTGYSGIDLFKAIYFFEGHAATRLPYFASIRQQIAAFPATQTTQRLNFNSEMITKMNSLNPNFFNKFQQKIYSKNPDTITAIIDEGASLLISALTQSSYSSNYTTANNVAATMNLSLYDFTTVDGINTYLKDYGNKVTQSTSVKKSTDVGACITFAAIFAVAVYYGVAVANYAAVVNVAAVGFAVAVLYAKVHFWGPETYGPRTPIIKLERETLVKQIVKNIATASTTTT